MTKLLTAESVVDKTSPNASSPTLRAAEPKVEGLVTRKIGDLVPYARNSRAHTQHQVAQIAASIQEFGFTNPVLIDEQDTIIAGEGRVLAAKSLKMPTVPCIVLPGLTDAQKAAYVIADNKLAINAGWDEAKLQAELDRLANLEYDLNLTGFSEAEIATLFETIGRSAEEFVAEVGALQPVESQDAAGPRLTSRAEAQAAAWKGMPGIRPAKSS